MLARHVCRVASVGRNVLFRSTSRGAPAQSDGRWVRTAFSWSIPALTQLLKKKGERRIGDVQWFDEYSDLGDDPNATHAAMVEEDQRLRASDVFKSTLRKQVFHEILKYRRAFQQVRCPLSPDAVAPTCCLSRVSSLGVCTAFKHIQYHHILYPDIG